MNVNEAFFLLMWALGLVGMIWRVLTDLESEFLDKWAAGLIYLSFIGLGLPILVGMSIAKWIKARRPQIDTMQHRKFESKCYCLFLTDELYYESLDYKEGWRYKEGWIE